METVVKKRTKRTNLSKKNRSESINHFEDIMKEQKSFIIGIAKNHKISMCKCDTCNGK
ncbi:MAG: hypothetical protein LBR10_13655 [Prevotellaceae bacterium]|jgi:hypothetical protein|nr:hypothetical protein [Prevotellaceae bacterium]